MKEKVVVDPDERDRWDVIVGVVTFALAIFVIIFAFAGYSGWSPSEHKIELRFDE